MVPLAHSADSRRGIPAQSYARHLAGVRVLANKALDAIQPYAPVPHVLRSAVQQAALWHDLGKLEDENQRVLTGEIQARTLPVPHVDAGTARLLQANIPLAATLVRSHHAPGLPDFTVESNRTAQNFLRDERIRERTNTNLPTLVERHVRTLQDDASLKQIDAISATHGMFLRLALSVLVDADHTDTATHYSGRNYSDEQAAIPELRPLERLAVLDDYVARLGAGQEESSRNRLRSEIYQACRTAPHDESIVACDSPVGSGKTTAVMANLLAQAAARGLRRIFVVLPFTNIISQSVKVFRKALVLDDEDPIRVVAEVHHRADYADYQSREYAALWNAPIVVTTAVTFFETMASCLPGSLRRLHNLPGSAVFLDEAHAALPTHLLPQAWMWLKCLADEWSCYWVLASGSLQHFWAIPEIDKTPRSVPDLVAPAIREQAQKYESRRVDYHYRQERLSLPDLSEWVTSKNGPRLLILNTVQSAAAVARYFKEQGHGVEHISTALTPHDRELTLQRVEQRLKDDDTDWTLIGTSCIEAGLDFSFRVGFREIASLTSLLQAAGRVNRGGAFEQTPIYSFRGQQGGLLREHPAFREASGILSGYFAQGQTITPALCTDAMRREIRAHAAALDRTLEKAEQQLRFPLVEEQFRVIASDTKTVIVNTEIIGRLEAREKVAWQEIQRNSVQIWGSRLHRLQLPEVRGYSEMYRWNLEYDTFLGYMKGILAVEDLNLTQVRQLGAITNYFLGVWMKKRPE